MAQTSDERSPVNTRQLKSGKPPFVPFIASLGVLAWLAAGCSEEQTAQAPSPTFPSSSSSSPKPSWGSGQEKKMTGIYQSVTPPYVLQLSYGGKAALEGLDSGNRYSGKWSVQDGVLMTIWDSNGSKTTYDINSDGSFKSSHGILFVKTQ